ncbi:MAG: AmmeMemoRadiSam system protein A [Deltaproteobacteria bacterium]|nr:AmmeMemoRadiSam system protein A [Deltaproteobacteria bacterium]
MAPLSEENRESLLRIARESIEAELRRESYEPAPPGSPLLSSPWGAFVSLHKGGNLRGCIGSFEGRGPLYRTVAEMARSAAFEDPRFRAVQTDELPHLRVEISVLTPLHPIDPSEVQVGRHGLYVVQGYHRGVLLPQVAGEHGWDAETFLAETCRKAGLPRDAWRKDAKLFAFEAEVFGER